MTDGNPTSQVCNIPVTDPPVSDPLASLNSLSLNSPSTTTIQSKTENALVTPEENRPSSSPTPQDEEPSVSPSPVSPPSSPPSSPSIKPIDFFTAKSSGLFNQYPLAADVLKSFTSVTEDGGVLKRVLRPAPVDARSPERGDAVECKYVGRLAEDGSEFDQSPSGYPFAFKLGEGKVIKGWEEGILKMHVGEIAQVWMDSTYAYGEKGSGDDIPPNSDLVFVVELVGFNQSVGNSGVVDPELERLMEIRKEREEAAAKRKVEAEAKKQRMLDVQARLANKGQKKGKGKGKKNKKDSKEGKKDTKKDIKKDIKKGGKKEGKKK